MSSIREIVTPSGVVVKVDRHCELNLINISANCGGTVTFTAIVNPLSWRRFKRALAAAERMMVEAGWLPQLERGSGPQLVRTDEDGVPVIPCLQEGIKLSFLIPCPYCGRKHIHGVGKVSNPPPPFSAGHRWAHCLAIPTTKGGRECKMPPGSEQGYYLQVLKVKRSNEK